YFTAYDADALRENVAGHSAQLADTTEAIARHGIDPETYPGSDFQKVQAAFDDAIGQNRSIVLTRVFDITPDTIVLNKASDLREPTIAVGVNGGGVKKTNSGLMFTSPTADVSDLQFDNTYFEGNESQNVKVFDCSKLIRLSTNGCYFTGITTIMYTDDTRYLQSIRMTNDTIVHNVGAALDFAGAYDTVLTNVLMERSSGNFINHRFLGTNANIYGFRIRDCIIEGLTGSEPAIKFKSCDSLLIDGCYFEHNLGGHIVFDATTSNLRHVTISNCRHGGSVDATSLIKWGRQCPGCFTFNNVSQNIGIHDTTQVVSGRILSIFDKSIFGTDTNIGNHIDYVKDSNDAFTPIAGVGGYRTVWGSMVRLTSTLTNQTINAGATITYTFDFLEPLYTDDMISIQIFSDNVKITLNNYYRIGNTVKAIITNDSASAKTISSMRATVLKAMPTVQG
ncbi:hypothetical protein, partial [Paenibacillus sp. VTT E-133291]|uniref:hypothetical protein n=1 Tax=Paenibacillus sp. VTT E-133291 TaxID=1986223 RepID=UPI000BC89C70